MERVGMSKFSFKRCNQSRLWKKRLRRDHFAAGFQLASRTVKKRNRAFQMMQHIGERNHIEAVVFYCVQFVDLVAVKHQIEIVKIENITRDDVRVKLFQGRGAASYLENRERRGIGKVLELIMVKFAIPEKEISIGAETSPIAQGCRTVFLLFTRPGGRAAHLTARM